MIAKGAILSLLVFAAALAPAADLTAYQLAAKGDKYIGTQSKDKIVQIRSDRSVGSLTPSVWYVVYYDPDAMLKAVQVKFGGGQMLEVSHPLRLIEPVTGDDRVLDHEKLKIDSNQALQTATAQPILKNLVLHSAQFWLQAGDLGPEWKIELWAAKIHDPSQDADIGAIYISAADGSIVKNDLHPENVN